MPAKALTGGCFCGAVRYAVEGEPIVVSHCHCVHCRRSSGAPFLTWAEFPRAGFRYVSGEPRTHRQSDRVTRTFCGDCGTQISYVLAGDHDTIDVTLGSLDDPEALRPEDHIWVTRQVSWAELADDLPRFAERHGTEQVAPRRGGTAERSRER